MCATSSSPGSSPSRGETVLAHLWITFFGQVDPECASRHHQHTCSHLHPGPNLHSTRLYPMQIPLLAGGGVDLWQPAGKGSALPPLPPAFPPPRPFPPSSRASCRLPGPAGGAGGPLWAASFKALNSACFLCRFALVFSALWFGGGMSSLVLLLPPLSPPLSNSCAVWKGAIPGAVTVRCGDTATGDKKCTCNRRGQAVASSIAAHQSCPPFIR